jgi:hypothetical protein
MATFSNSISVGTFTSKMGFVSSTGTTSVGITNTFTISFLGVI